MVNQYRQTIWIVKEFREALQDGNYALARRIQKANPIIIALRDCTCSAWSMIPHLPDCPAGW